MLYLAKFSLRFDGDQKFYRQAKLKDLSNTKLDLQEMLKGLI